MKLTNYAYFNYKFFFFFFEILFNYKLTLKHIVKLGNKWIMYSSGMSVIQLAFFFFFSFFSFDLFLLFFFLSSIYYLTLWGEEFSRQISHAPHQSSDINNWASEPTPFFSPNQYASSWHDMSASQHLNKLQKGGGHPGSQLLIVF